MKQGSDDMPVSCCLLAKEVREREATLLAQFTSAVTATEELPDGYAFRLPAVQFSGGYVTDTKISDSMSGSVLCCPCQERKFIAPCAMLASQHLT